jgi:hypothetical protein
MELFIIKISIKSFYDMAAIHSEIYIKEEENVLPN